MTQKGKLFQSHLASKCHSSKPVLLKSNAFGIQQNLLMISIKDYGSREIQKRGLKILGERDILPLLVSVIYKLLICITQKQCGTVA